MKDGKKEDQDSGLTGMFTDYFLDYASYVILERAVPALEDGFKPVQRRILHSMKEMDDGRYHKVANIIGHTMQYHPHGDAAIGDALVNMGQKGLLIDCQGNWGDERTGDSAAASRYIEARLTKFALEVLYSPDITDWQLSYDGRKKEPVTLPVKFPMVLAMGVEGIAVGLSTRILPHNFCELLEASIKYLEGRRFRLYPDFSSCGLIDVSQYEDGKRGGRIKSRARILKMDKKTLVIRELPFGITTGNLIDSIIKANEKGKIKIKRVVDNTAKDVEIVIELPSGTSPDITIDALYAFTDCDRSISPNGCVIVDDKPRFTSVTELLTLSTDRTVELLRLELELLQGELEEKWHFSSLEKIFIGERIYRDIEESESWEEVLQAIRIGLHKYVSTPGHPEPTVEEKLKLKRDITDEDIRKLTEIRIKRISKYNVFKAEEALERLLDELAEVRDNLANITRYAVQWFQGLLDTYGQGRERKTEIIEFDEISAAVVAANNVKLYVNRKEGFIGSGLRKDEFVCECSDIDDIITFQRDGKMMVTRIAEKTYVGKRILHADVWRKGDQRTTYNMIYVDGKTGVSRAKRFHVKSITRDKEYDMTTGTPGSRILYMTANPNGEAEVVTVHLTQGCRARKKIFDFDFGELDIRGRSSKGNIVTKYPVQKVNLKEVGKSTIGAQEYWMDEVSGRINTEERGMPLGLYDTGDTMLLILNDGSYIVAQPEENKKLPAGEILEFRKFDPDTVVSCVYYDGHKKWSMVKRFQIETQTLDQRFPFLTDHRRTELLYATLDPGRKLRYSYTSKGEKITDLLDLDEFIDVKGWRALGNKLSEYKVRVAPIDPEDRGGTLAPGDTVEFDVEDNGQTSLFRGEDEDD